MLLEVGTAEVHLRGYHDLILKGGLLLLDLVLGDHLWFSRCVKTPWRRRKREKSLLLNLSASGTRTTALARLISLPK